MILALLIAAAPAADSAGGASAPVPPVLSPAVNGSAACKSDNADEVVVCAKPGDRYRIDSSVLEAGRARDALPPKPAPDANRVASNGCVGPASCTGAVVPLVRMALVAARAAALAANGDDWRDAIRTHEDEYRLYQQAEKRRASERKVRIGIAVGPGK